MIETIKSLVIAFAFLLGFMSAGQAQICLDSQLKIDFTDPADAQAKATWSPADMIGITPKGLGWKDGRLSGEGPWVETKPFALGLSWRPATSASVSVKITLLPRPLDPKTCYSYEGAVFVRFSPDAKNWSTWQALQQQDKASGEQDGFVFKGEVGVPYRKREKYDALVEEYSGLDVPWRSDEEAAVKWILAKDPRFFQKNLPFVGYVEFLYESNFDDGHRLTELSVEMGVSLGGVASSPKDPNAEKNPGDDVPWRYKAD